MIDLAGLTPIGVRCLPDSTRLQWRVDGKIVETGLERFLPVGLTNLPQSEELHVLWRDFGDVPLSEPFFKGSLDKAIALPKQAGAFETDLDVMKSAAATADSLPFSGVIFHMARTGSTLVHRLLSKSGIVASISENTIVDRALMVAEDWSEHDRNELLQSLVKLIGRPRRPSDRHLVLKMTDATPSARLPVFRAAFPTVPWIFIYRDPVEVIVSMLRKPTGTIEQWYKNRAQIAQRLGMPTLVDGGMWPAEFMARTLRKFCLKAVEAAKATPPGLFLAVHYKRLPDAIFETIAPHFGIVLSEKQREAMLLEARYSSKKTDSTEFQPDSDSKNTEATPRVRELAKQYVEPLIEQLKMLPQG